MDSMLVRGAPRTKKEVSCETAVQKNFISLRQSAISTFQPIPPKDSPPPHSLNSYRTINDKKLKASNKKCLYEYNTTPTLRSISAKTFNFDIRSKEKRFHCETNQTTWNCCFNSNCKLSPCRKRLALNIPIFDHLQTGTKISSKLDKQAPADKTQNSKPVQESKVTEVPTGKIMEPSVKKTVVPALLTINIDSAAMKPPRTVSEISSRFYYKHRNMLRKGHKERAQPSMCDNYIYHLNIHESQLNTKSISKECVDLQVPPPTPVPILRFLPNQQFLSSLRGRGQ